MSETLITATKGQRKQIIRFVEDGLDAITLSKDGAQRVIKKGNEMRKQFQGLIRELAGERYVDEEVESNYGYFSGYKPKGIIEQTNILRQFFPGIGSADEKLAEQPLPPNAEGWFAIPRWEKIAPTYGEAVGKGAGHDQPDPQRQVLQLSPARSAVPASVGSHGEVLPRVRRSAEQSGHPDCSRPVRQASCGPFGPSGARSDERQRVRSWRLRGRDYAPDTSGTSPALQRSLDRLCRRRVRAGCRW